METQNIVVRNPKEFLIYLNSILKIVPSCKFIINKNGCTVRAVQESGTVKAFFELSSVLSKEPIEFCLLDVQKLSKAISLIVDYDPESEKGIAIKYDTGKIHYTKKGLSFKFTTVREDTVERYITNPLKRELVGVFGMKINNKIISKVNSLAGISSAEKPKLYLSCSNNIVSAEVDDKTNAISDMAGIPIAQETNIIGNWTQTVCLNLDTFRLYGAIDSEDIEVNMTDRGVMLVNSSSNNIKMKLVSTVLKG